MKLPSFSHFARRHGWPLLWLLALSTFYWFKVLAGTQVLLPGTMLSGFAPFGAAPDAPWNILQWDALGQYFPWRHFAAQQLQAGKIPLWNPYQFAGTPFIANGQSAVFYPLNLPFCLFDTARAFGFSAWLHTILAAFGIYFLAQQWKLSRAASVLAAMGFAFCGYLAAWAMLPTLAATASWLPWVLCGFERAVAPRAAGNTPKVLAGKLSLSRELCLLALALACALLAGHAQVFFYIVLALLLRAIWCGLSHSSPSRWRNLSRSVAIAIIAIFWCGFLVALQILPILELARLGHRAAQGGASAAGWQFVHQHALQPLEILSLLFPDWPMQWGSLNENFGYAGVTLVLLGGVGLVCALRRREATAGFAAALAAFGLLYALATPVAQLFYFAVPGVAQMGGTGRALLLWNLGLALLAGFGLDALRARFSLASTLSAKSVWQNLALPSLAILVVLGELFFAGRIPLPTAARAAIYPPTPLTNWLRNRVREDARALFLTPRGGWRPAEFFENGRTHPPGVLPPNGAGVYGLFDVNGYDSLAILKYREFVAAGESANPSPQWNGNMILLNNLDSPALDSLQVLYIVSLEPLTRTDLREVWRGDNAIVYQRRMKNVPRVAGRDFYPGWREGVYQPETFRFGTFLSLCALALLGMVAAQGFWKHKEKQLQ